MERTNLLKPALGAAILFVIALLAWEWYLRHDGVNNAYDDNAALFAHQRGKIYQAKDHSTIFIGSSRIKFDLDLPTWTKLTGDQPVQLACVGSTPIPVLHDLAKDEKFKGKLIIDVTEPLFFSLSPGNARRPNEGVDYFHDQTPAQRASFAINTPLEASFVFLDKDNYSINALLDKLRIKSRPGVFEAPIFPRDFERTQFTRQSGMMPAFVADTAQQHIQQGIWAFFASLRSGPPLAGTKLDSVINAVKISIDKIKSRGGEVIFVRTPSSGPFLEGEKKGFPRELYWEKLLHDTGIPGIHFMDDPATDHYVCPEFSHLSPSDAIDYTHHLVGHLRAAGWKFPKSN